VIGYPPPKPTNLEQRTQSQNVTAIQVKARRINRCSHAISVPLSNDLRFASFREAGLNEVKNSAGINHALRNLRLVEPSAAPKA
jgi:hypothetical protein